MMRPLPVLCALLLAACAGYRGGWESVPYVGETPPALPEARTPFEARQRSELRLPGLTLAVGINNQTRTYDTQVYLFALPLSIDPRTVQTQPVEAGKTRVSLRVAGTEGDFVFRPQQARLTVAGQTVTGSVGFEFGQWDAAGNRVGSGGRWAHRPVGEALALSDGARSHLLSIDFPLPTPSPQDAGIVLDLSQALQAPGRPAIPPIRFQPARWKEGYT
jgi:hypothetical protein